jgi:CRISPR/Cas system-associated exonuclease Cas4 (RecB family)
MKTLQIYPTSRAIRKQQEELRDSNALLPTLMRIDEFEQRVLLLPDSTMVDRLQRVILLQKSAKFDSFSNLKINRDLVKFFTRSDSILKFFEELIYEEVSFYDLVDGDAYVEFGEHIEILEELLSNYRRILTNRGLTDRVFIPENYRLNLGFITSFDNFELYLEGYMSNFELKIIEEIAKHKPFIIHMQTSKFNKKIQDRFLNLGIEGMEEDSFISFDLQSKKIISIQKNSLKINAKVVSVEERLAQIPIIFESIQSMVESGISPEEIVLILPDEKFKNTIHLYDRLNNFNFAMGFDYNKTKAYKRVEAIYHYWQSFSNESIFLLKKYEIERERLNEITPSRKLRVEDFFELMTPFGLDLDRKIVNDSMLYFHRLFREEKMSLKNWLFLWLQQLSRLTLDDVRGGKITVIGALETRGVSFRGVVIIDFNDGIVPAIPAKDSFLNSTIRKFANLPTKNDRTALQKQLYKRIVEEAQEATIIYSTSNNKTPTSYLYELGLGIGEQIEPNLEILYSEARQVIDNINPIVENFDAKTITWSATRLKSFLSCRRKYYYIYEQKLKPKDEDDINEGQFLHKVLENLFKEQLFYSSIEDMKRDIYRLIDNLLETSSPKIAYSKLLWREKLKKFILNQVEHFNAGWRVLEREKHIVGEIGGIRFKGVVDRVDKRESDTLILDYKSGSLKEANRAKNLEKLTDFQMSIYYELLKEKYPNIELAFVELFNNGEIVPITLLEEKNNLLFETIKEIKKMKTLIAKRCDEVSRCQYCDFTLLCERGEYL